MNQNEISDKRLIKAFKGITFSNFKKTEAKKELLNNLSAGKIEPSCYWAAEFICAGHFLDVWDIFLLFIGKNIHIGNPKLPIYIEMRINDFKNILNNGYTDNLLKMRNNNKIRKLFAEVICVICLSKKKHSFDNIKIQKEDFNVTKLSHKLKAKNISYASKIFMKEDPKELFIAINEFYWNLLSSQKNGTEACYWLEWISGFEDACKKEKKKFICERRNVPVESKLQKDIIWIVWDCLLLESSNRSKGHHKLIKALLNLYCLKFTPGVKKRRKYLIYFAIHLLTETLDNSIPIISDKNIIQNVTSKINVIYKQIKKNEIKPDTDYLFNNSFTNNNLEKTIAKLDKMNALSGMVPRNN
jgi:hypothetical protein